MQERPYATCITDLAIFHISSSSHEQSIAHIYICAYEPIKAADRATCNQGEQVHTVRHRFAGGPGQINVICFPLKKSVHKETADSGMGCQDDKGEGGQNSGCSKSPSLEIALIVIKITPGTSSVHASWWRRWLKHTCVVIIVWNIAHNMVDQHL